MRAIGLVLVWVLLTSAGFSEEKQIRVFVALCDNETQGIAKVNPRIGDGDNAAANLYWGCSDGLKSYFQKSSKWKLIESTENPSAEILESLTFRHSTFKNVTLIADAYRGSEMKKCLTDFFDAAGGTEQPELQLVAFIGHNGLMDHPNLEKRVGHGKRDVIVLSCLSYSWFSNRFEEIAVNQVLMTRSLMYPGSFLLHDALEGWFRGESKADIRERAARAYAKNQKISVKSARSIFSAIE